MSDIKKFNAFLLDDIMLATEDRILASDYEIINESIEQGQRYLIAVIEKALRDGNTEEALQLCKSELRCRA